MKENKPLRQGQPARTMPRTSLQDDQEERDPATPRSQSGTIQQLPLRAAPAMQNEFPMRKTRSEEHTSELQSPCNLVCRLLLEKKKKKNPRDTSSNHYYSNLFRQVSETV